MITHVNHHEDNNNKEGINRSQFEENFLTAMDEGDLPTEVKLAWYHAVSVFILTSKSAHEKIVS